MTIWKRNTALDIGAQEILNVGGGLLRSQQTISSNVTVSASTESVDGETFNYVDYTLPTAVTDYTRVALDFASFTRTGATSQPPRLVAKMLNNTTIRMYANVGGGTNEIRGHLMEFGPQVRVTNIVKALGAADDTKSVVAATSSSRKKLTFSHAGVCFSTSTNNTAAGTADIFYAAGTDTVTIQRQNATIAALAAGSIFIVELPF